MLRRIARVTTITLDGGDKSFLWYCKYHVEEDGPGALFTDHQITRLERLAGMAVPRGRGVGGVFEPAPADVLAAVDLAKARAMTSLPILERR